MISINTNLSSLIAQQSLKQSSNKLNQAVERMSTGFKINHAKDNAANYSISTNMTTKIGAYQVAEDNVAMGLDLLSTANGSLDQISDKLSRLRALAEQSANGTYGGGKSKLAINAEANSLVDEIERLYNTTEYNGINLAKGRVVGTEESKFIKDVDRRDTSKMDKLADVKIDEKLEYGTYSISTPEELAKLATMTNNGLIGDATEFVLANDIDLQAWCDANSATGGWVPIGVAISDSVFQSDQTTSFRGTFDGNGYTISNLSITDSDSYGRGLFGFTANAEIKNLGVNGSLSISTAAVNGLIVGKAAHSIIKNCYTEGEISSSTRAWVGGLVGILSASTMDNCYSSAKVVGTYFAGGLTGSAYGSTIFNCYSNGEIRGNKLSGGLLGEASYSIKMENCYFPGTFQGANNYCGGIIGTINASKDSHINNTYLYGEAEGINSIFGKVYSSAKNISIVNSGQSSYYSGKSIPLIEKKNISDDYVVTNYKELAVDEMPVVHSNQANIISHSAELSFQVGITSEESSSILSTLSYNLAGVNAFRNLCNNMGHADYLTISDNLINYISNKQTELGAAQNRLESALDEISTQYENLVSSRSTLRDADISEVSSEYIRQQILQEASATLLATANQNPMIALQLL